MKIMTKLNLLSIGIVVVMTFTVLGAGTWIISDILYKFSEQVLRLELENAGKAVLQELNRSGVRAAAAMASDMDRQLSRKAGMRSTKLYIVEAPDNRAVFHPDFPAGERVPFGFIDEMFRREHGIIEYMVGDVPSYAVFTTVQPVGWLLGLSISKEEMLERRGLFLHEVGAITVIVLVLNAMFVSLFGRRLLKRIDATIDCVSRVEKGDLSARVTTSPVRDEIGLLQEGINTMCERIEQRTLEQKNAEKALREREARIRRLVESNIIGIFLWDLQGNITDANDAFLDIIGYSRKDMETGRIQWNRLTPPEFSEVDARKVEEVRRNHTCTPYEKEFWRKDCTRVPVMLGAAMFEEEGENGVAFVLDLTERKHADVALRKAHDELELRVQQRTAELKRSNAELEQLAYVASHDLQEPLRMIASYLQLLEKRYIDRLDADGRDFIDFAVDGAKRMQALIEDMLIYSRVGTTAENMQLTDCGKVVAAVLRSLHVAIQESGVKIHCSPLPVVMADPTQLEQLFQNLIANAIKFHNDTPPAIEIDAELADGVWQFSVRDNGIGIAPEYCERIFVMFQRLHGRREYPGTGIGLAICKKIVERHNGRIWVESVPGKGATFRFTLPRPPLDMTQDHPETVALISSVEAETELERKAL